MCPDLECASQQKLVTWIRSGPTGPCPFWMSTSSVNIWWPASDVQSCSPIIMHVHTRVSLSLQAPCLVKPFPSMIHEFTSLDLILVQLSPIEVTFCLGRCNTAVAATWWWQGGRDSQVDRILNHTRFLCESSMTGPPPLAKVIDQSSVIVKDSVGTN